MGGLLRDYEDVKMRIMQFYKIIKSTPFERFIKLLVGEIYIDCTAVRLAHFLLEAPDPGNDIGRYI